MTVLKTHEDFLHLLFLNVCLADRGHIITIINITAGQNYSLVTCSLQCVCCFLVLSECLLTMIYFTLYNLSNEYMNDTF